VNNEPVRDMTEFLAQLRVIRRQHAARLLQLRQQAEQGDAGNHGHGRAVSPMTTTSHTTSSTLGDLHEATIASPTLSASPLPPASFGHATEAVSPPHPHSDGAESHTTGSSSGSPGAPVPPIEADFFVRLTTINRSGVSRILSLRLDDHYWPSWELFECPNSVSGWASKFDLE
ncbi:hypothetical protein IWQ60_012598, partial [Tieghemiomyces parasiticus]